ncbi:hypothetical protein [Saccharothrix luteola]|uniref:hypothetical protein n=1 Tax=Saccharothrix luteola TaxID=2893018 RepID=UPI001E31547F|nr:hypothetical protein [Saccharothrix luteola]MCC8244936.1 hypothetical protein [Saccharothrix luteola]
MPGAANNRRTTSSWTSARVAGSAHAVATSPSPAASRHPVLGPVEQVGQGLGEPVDVEPRPVVLVRGDRADERPLRLGLEAPQRVLRPARAGDAPSSIVERRISFGGLETTPDG